MMIYIQKSSLTNKLATAMSISTSGPEALVLRGTFNEDFHEDFEDF